MNAKSEQTGVLFFLERVNGSRKQRTERPTFPFREQPLFWGRFF